jgi:hypothetical protein
MATQGTGIYLRKALDDSGAVPYSGGTWTNSPDIISNGTTVVANPQTTFGGNNYSTDQGQPTVFDQTNYFYMRGKNLSASSENADLYLYYCPQNLFLFPSLWTSNQLKTSSGKDKVSVNAAKTNDIVVTGEPFTYVPANQIHSCLIGRVVTPQNPNKLPNDGDFQTMDDLAKYIMNHPNMGWRNVVLVDKDIPTFTNTFSLDTTSLPLNTNSQFLCGISYKNLTVGSQLAFSSGTSIPSGPDQGKVIQLVQTAVTQNSGSLGTSYLTIPSGYKTNVSFTYWAKPPIQSNWSIQFYAIYIPSEASELNTHTKAVHKLGIPGLEEHPQVRALAGSDGITKGIRLGDVSLNGIDAD